MLQRQSNIELCRIISIVFVMLVHTTFLSLKGVEQGYGVLLLAAFSIIGPNVFVLITGYFSVTPKKSSLINLAFICLFWMIVKMVCDFVFLHEFNWRNLFFITSSSWFIPCYIGLLLISPVLNEFCKNVSNKMLWTVIFALLCFEFWFDNIPPRPEMDVGFHQGYSIFSFIVLYLLARAIKLYGLPRVFKQTAPIIYIVCSILTASIAWYLIQHGHGAKLLYAYDSPLNVLSSVCFFVLFECIHIESRIINHIAKSALAVLLGHAAIMSFYTAQFKYLYTHMSGLFLVGYWILSILVAFAIIVLIDQVRIVLYNPINRVVKNKIKNDGIFH